MIYRGIRVNATPRELLRIRRLGLPEPLIVSVKTPKGSGFRERVKEKEGDRLPQREIWRDRPQRPLHYVRESTGDVDRRMTECGLRVPEYLVVSLPIPNEWIVGVSDNGLTTTINKYRISKKVVGHHFDRFRTEIGRPHYLKEESTPSRSLDTRGRTLVPGTPSRTTTQNAITPTMSEKSVSGYVWRKRERIFLFKWEIHVTKSNPCPTTSVAFWQ